MEGEASLPEKVVRVIKEGVRKFLSGGSLKADVQWGEEIKTDDSTKKEPPKTDEH